MAKISSANIISFFSVTLFHFSLVKSLELFSLLFDNMLFYLIAFAILSSLFLIVFNNSKYFDSYKSVFLKALTLITTSYAYHLIFYKLVLLQFNVYHLRLIIVHVFAFLLCLLSTFIFKKIYEK